MAFQFTDTFCNITAVAQSPYEQVVGTPTYSSAFARFVAPAGTLSGGIQMTGNCGLRKNLSSSQSHFIAFCSYGKGNIFSSTLNRIMGFWATGAEQTSLLVNTAGALQFYRAGTPIGVATASGIILASQSAPACGIEIEIVSSATVGVANLWFNGTQLLSQTGLNTGATAPNQFQVGDITGGVNNNMITDYVRVWDATGSTQNAPVGKDRQPVTKLPNATGVSTGWTPSGATPNFNCVNVVPPSGSKFVSANGTAIIDDYGMPNAGLTATPSMVVAQSYYQKTDSNTRTYTNGVLSSGVKGVGSTFTANSTLTWVQNCIPNDPATSVPWTAPGADAAHFLHEELT